jgi:GTP-binding protein
VALSKADALTPDMLEEQTARLQRACGRAPLVLSSASRQGVQEVLRMLLGIIDGTRPIEEHEIDEPAEWHP